MIIQIHVNLFYSLPRFNLNSMIAKLVPKVAINELKTFKLRFLVIQLGQGLHSRARALSALRLIISLDSGLSGVPGHLFSPVAQIVPAVTVQWVGGGGGVAHLRDLFCVIYRPVLSNFLFPSVFLTNTLHVLSLQNRVPCPKLGGK